MPHTNTERALEVALGQRIRTRSGDVAQPSVRRIFVFAHADGVFLAVGSARRDHRHIASRDVRRFDQQRRAIRTRAWQSVEVVGGCGADDVFRREEGGCERGRDEVELGDLGVVVGLADAEALDHFAFRTVREDQQLAARRDAVGVMADMFNQNLNVLRVQSGCTAGDDAADRMARQLLKIAESADSESVRLAAVRDALDRAGLKAPTQVDLEVGPKPFEQIFAGMANMTRAESRAARGIPDPVPAPLAALPVAQPRPQVVEGEVVGGPTQNHTGNRPYWAGDACAPTDRGSVPGEPSAPGTGLMTLAEANEQLHQQQRNHNMRQDRHRQ